MGAWGSPPVGSPCYRKIDSLRCALPMLCRCAMLTSDAPVLCRCAVSDALLCLLRQALHPLSTLCHYRKLSISLDNGV